MAQWWQQREEDLAAERAAAAERGEDQEPAGPTIPPGADIAPLEVCRQRLTRDRRTGEETFCEAPTELACRLCEVARCRAHLVDGCRVDADGAMDCDQDHQHNHGCCSECFLRAYEGVGFGIRPEGSWGEQLAARLWR